MDATTCWGYQQCPLHACLGDRHYLHCLSQGDRRRLGEAGAASVQPALALPLLNLPTKASTCHDFLLALGKASMTQTWTHPQLLCLGWGWFKRSWFKEPGSPGLAHSRQDTVALI
eukprot:3066423-Amphidinium_carterae.1